VRSIQDSTPNPNMTGFRLMPIGFSSLDARVELARRAVHSLDVQYYLIANDRTGRCSCGTCATRRCAAFACACSSMTSTPPAR